VKEKPCCGKCAYGRALGKGIDRSILCLLWGGAYEYNGRCAKYDTGAEAKKKARGLWDELAGGDAVTLNLRYEPKARKKDARRKKEL